MGQITAERAGRFYVTWGDGKYNVYSDHELVLVKLEKKVELKLKSDFEIATTTETFRANVLTLQALGYPIFKHTLNDVASGSGMGNFKSLCRRAANNSDEEVQRGSMQSGANTFSNMGDFLIFHFKEEKSKAKIELEAMQVKMDEMQAQMEKLKEAVDNE